MISFRSMSTRCYTGQDFRKGSEPKIERSDPSCRRALRNVRAQGYSGVCGQWLPCHSTTYHRRGFQRALYAYSKVRKSFISNSISECLALINSEHSPSGRVLLSTCMLRSSLRGVRIITLAFPFAEKQCSARLSKGWKIGKSGN